MTEYAVELDEKNYGRVHVAGCRDLRDPEPVGTDLLNAHVELWPENEPFTEAEALGKGVSAPCARDAYLADKKKA